jgi:hypothetical protein
VIEWMYRIRWDSAKKNHQRECRGGYEYSLKVTKVAAVLII